MIRALVAARLADDRELLTQSLGADVSIELVAVASRGSDAVLAARKHRPDIVLLDATISGPGSDEVTREIMAEVPTPIMVLLSSRSTESAALAQTALEAGALVIVEMPAHDRAPEHGEELLTMVRAMAGVKVVRRRPQLELGSRGPRSRAKRGGGRIVVIASSTGGPAALRTVLAALPVDFPAPLLVVQHMTVDFIASLVRWLSGQVRIKVRLATHGELLKPGTAYFAPDSSHLGIGVTGAAEMSPEEPIGGFRPSATHLFESAARLYGAGVVAVVLTGMGNDGVAGLRAVQRSGGHILAQDEASSIVFGMPGEAVRSGLVNEVLPIEVIGQRITQLVSGD